MFDLATETVLFLVGAAFLAGFVDSIAGGGGLITVPALLLAGFSPVESLGTNKLQGLFGAGSATFAYARGGHVDLRRQLPSALLAFGGAVLGALLATLLPGEWLRVALPFLLIAIALYFALRPNMGDIDRAEEPVIKADEGHDQQPEQERREPCGPGTGSFFMLAFVALAGYGMLKATAHTKLLNFASNIGGFVAFAAAGVVAWKIGLAMGVAQFLGARLGASLAMKAGARLIKPLLVLVCIALALRLLLDPQNPVRVWLGF